MAKKKVTLNYYKMQIRKEKQLTQKINLYGEIDGKDIYAIMNDFYQAQTKFSNDEKELKVFSVKQKIGREEINGAYYGGLLIRTGDYGIESEIINVENSQTSYSKKENDADIMEFSIFYTSPKKESCDFMIVAFQNRGQYGVKTTFMKYLNEYFNNSFSGYKVIMSPIAPVKYIEQLLDKNQIKELLFMKYFKENDSRHRIDSNAGITGYETKIATFKKPKIDINRIKSILKPGKRLCEFGTVEGVGDDYEEIKIVFDVEGGSKTISLKNLEGIMYTENISNEITTGDSLLDLVPIFREKCERILKDFNEI